MSLSPNDFLIHQARLVLEVPCETCNEADFTCPDCGIGPDQERTGWRRETLSLADTLREIGRYVRAEAEAASRSGERETLTEKGRNALALAKHFGATPDAEDNPPPITASLQETK